MAKPTLGESVRMLGSGMARKAGDATIRANKRKKKRLDEIMGAARSQRRKK